MEPPKFVFCVNFVLFSLFLPLYSKVIIIGGIFGSNFSKSIFQDAVEELNSKSNGTAHVFFESRIAEINTNGSLLENVERFCREIESEVHVVVSRGENGERIFSSAALHGLNVPVFDISPDLKTNSPALSLPSLSSRLAYAIPHVFQKIQWKRFAVITTNSWQSAEFLSFLHQTAGKSSLDIIKTEQLGNKPVRDLLKNLLDARVNIIVLFIDDISDWKNIQPSANNLEMTIASFAWIIVTVTRLEVIKVTEKLPSLTFIVQPSQNKSTDAQREKKNMVFFLEFVKDILNHTGKINQRIAASNACHVTYSEEDGRLDVNANTYRNTKVMLNNRYGNQLYVSNLDLMIARHDVEARTSLYNLGEWRGGELVFNESAFRKIRPYIPEDVSVLPTLRVAIVEYVPWVMLSKNVSDCLGLSRVCERKYKALNRTEKYCIYGIAVDLMIIIESRLGVRFEYYYIEDGNFGIFNKRTGHWNGIVEDLMHNEADMGVGLAITHERAKVIDFAEPNSKIGLAIIVKINNAEHQEPNDVFKFLLPFDLNAWLCVLGIVHLFIVLIWGTEKALHRNVPFFEIAMYLISIALGRDTGNDMRPQSMTGRWLSTVFSFISLVVVAAYSANLAAYYIVDKTNLPISGILDPKLTAPNTGLTYSTTKNSRNEIYFRDHRDPRIAEMYKEIKKHQVKGSVHGVDMVKKGELTGYIGERPSLEYAVYIDPECQLALAGSQELGITSWAFAFPRGSHWKDKVSKEVLTLQEQSLIEQLYDNWMGRIICKKKKGFNVMKASDLGGLWLIEGVLIMISLLCTIVVIIYRYRGRSKRVTSWEFESDGSFGEGNNVITKSTSMYW
ncbi:glutamate receptor ionotropic, NMDA 3B [Nematostella vectensis]|uniref:glutamate receptor ionotropic, NMDA 3B n=1 Tax=Nematostella vectensis TaxID=45351 RepID=UPI0013904483|nr:glutamate receptor ionotropic, NMDA 3B [Nematostella vectensis]